MSPYSFIVLSRPRQPPPSWFSTFGASASGTLPFFVHSGLSAAASFCSIELSGPLHGVRSQLFFACTLYIIVYCHYRDVSRCVVSQVQSSAGMAICKASMPSVLQKLQFAREPGPRSHGRVQRLNPIGNDLRDI